MVFHGVAPDLIRRLQGESLVGSWWRRSIFQSVAPDLIRRLRGEL